MIDTVLTGLLLWALSYLVGAISPGYVLVRWLKGADIRTLGSGSTGATNVMRVAGKAPALGVFLFDIGKGFLALKITQLVMDPSGYGAWWAVGSGLLASLGHSRSVWLNWQGGKSVAVSLGLLFAVDVRVALATFALWGLSVALTRFVSIGSVLGGLGVAGFMIWFNQPLPYVLLGACGGLYVVLRHQSNLLRLWQGTEPRIGEKITS